MLISIITASLNSGQTIGNCIESIKSQSFGDFEHIVCDGGSGDGTVGILKAHQVDYPLQWTSGADTGIANALNRAFAMTKGRYVIVIQADDVLIEPRILDHVAHCISAERYDICSFPVIRERPGSSPFLYRPIKVLWWYHFKFTIPHQGAFVHRRLFEKIGGFREEFSIAMDYDFFYRAFAAKASLRFFSRPVSRMGGCGISSGRQVLLKRLEEEKKVQELNEKSLLWRAAQKAFRSLYIPYKTRCLGWHKPPCVRVEPPPLRDMLDILVITKRQYTGKDLLDDEFGRIWELPLGLASKGHNVRGLCLSYKRKNEGIIKNGPVTWESINAGILKFPGLLRFITKASRYAAESDIIWACSDSFYGIIGYGISRKHRIPLVFDLYDNFEYFFAAKLPVMRQIYRYVVKKSDAVTCVSRPLAHLVGSYGRKGPIHVLENGVSRELFQPLDKRKSRLSLGLPLDAKIIGTAGALESNRGISILFDAFLALKEKRDDLCLAVAGPRRTAISVDERIIDLGSLPYERVPLFLNALDVAVICNHANDFGKYCFPQKAREMMACRVPLVAARVGAMEELFHRHSQWLYEPGDLGSLIRALETRLQDRSVDYDEIPTWSDLAGQLEEIMVHLQNPDFSI